MTVINGAFFTTGVNAPAVLTVPAGVTRDMWVLIVTSNPTTTAYTITPATSGSGTFQQVDARQATNQYVVVIKGTGFVAGDTITVTPSTTGTLFGVAHQYRSGIAGFGTPGVAIRGASSASVTTGPVSPGSGRPVVVLTTDRTIAAPTFVSATSSGGEAVTQTQFVHDLASTNANVGFFFGEFVSNGTAGETATVTLSSASTNGAGYAIPVLTTSPFAGAVAAVSGAVGRLKPWTYALAGSEAAVSGATAEMTVRTSLDGTAAATSVLVAAMTLRAALAGTAPALSTATATMTSLAGLAGTAAATSTVSGAMTVTTTAPMSGQHWPHATPVVPGWGQQWPRAEVTLP